MTRSARMRIGLVGPVYPYRGGIAHYTTLMERSLRARQHDLLLISFKRQYPQWLYPGRSDRDPSTRPMVAEVCPLLDRFSESGHLAQYGLAHLPVQARRLGLTMVDRLLGSGMAGFGRLGPAVHALSRRDHLP